MPRRTPLEPWTPKRRHRPPHAYDAGKAVFVTGSTVDRKPYLRSRGRKGEFLALMGERCEKFTVDLLAWVVLDEHYHVVIHPQASENVSEWLNSLHSLASRNWNREDETPGRQCLYQSWDSTLWTEGDLWSRINYTHLNPVKHGYVADPRDWEWSSLREFDAVWRDDEACQARDRFPAPRKLPHDDF